MTQDRTDHTETDSRQPRRTVLRAAGLTAVAGGGAVFLGACAADREAASGATGAGSSSAPSSAASSAAPSPSAAESSASSAPEATAKAPDGPSVTTADVPVEGGIILAGSDYVVTQPAKGEFKAFTKICTHKGCPVAEVVDKKIHCNCHQSNFSIEDGSVLNGPASAPLKEFKTEVIGKKVYVTG